jgi:hypothetical protein
MPGFDPKNEPLMSHVRSVHHARDVTFQLAEVAVPRKLFRAILRRIAKLRLSATRGSPV